MEYEVTIGVPVYNVEKNIHLMLDSVLSQTFESIELLILDDCGTDRSIDIVHQYQQTHPRGKHIRIVQQPRNMGIGNGRNRILSETHTPYVYFMDADDAIAPRTIELLYQQAQRYQADIVYGSYERIEEFNGDTKKSLFQYPAMQFLNDNEFADFVYNDYDFLQATTWNFLIRTEIFTKNHIKYNPVNYWEDFTTTIDLPCYIHRAVLLPDVTYSYYCRYGSASGYEEHQFLSKETVQQTIDAMALVKANSRNLKSRPYFHKRMYKVMATHFYMACTIIKYEKITDPPFTMREIRDVMTSPLTLTETLRLKGWRLKNLALCLLGVLPPWLSVFAIRWVGKCKGLV